jgi:hypothetical protein
VQRSERRVDLTLIGLALFSATAVISFWRRLT